jgi:hypothetical protein
MERIIINENSAALIGSVARTKYPAMKRSLGTNVEFAGSTL